MYAPLSPEEETSATALPKSDKVPIVPVPADAPPMKFKHPKLGEPSRSWPYHDAEGRLVGYVCRWDFADGEGQPAKEIMPVTFCDLGNGRRGWRSKGMPAPRPLFGLPEILARPDAPVLIVEGEKTRDAAAVLFPDMVATTPAHGAKSPHLSDFSPLIGRKVIVATDFDEPGRTNDKGKPLHPGRDFGDKVCELAHAVGAAEVLHLAPERLGAWSWRGGERVERLEPLPDGWDLADALAEGWTADAAAIVLAEPDFLRPYVADAELVASPKPVHSAFRVSESGVEKRIERVDKETGDVTIEWRWFCSHLEVAAVTRSSEGEEWGRLLVVTDPDGLRKQWAMPMSLLAGDGATYRERLLSLGLILAPGPRPRDALHEYISTARPNAKARCVSRVGWQRKTYVRLSGSLGGASEGERYIMQTTGPVDHAYRQHGMLRGWQDGVARFAIGNSRLALALSAAFAAPLLYPTSSESGGFHLRGGSSTGKTTALVVAGSVWGGGGVRGFIRTWRATSNGLEGVAAMHCDALLCLDEMGQVDGREAGQIAYMLANGVGKARASRTGEARPAAEWRMLFLSSGELSLADKIAEDGRGRRVAAGQQVRIVDLAADAGAGLGIFENLHGFASGDTLSRHLKMAASEHYGIAASAFLEQITRGFDELAPTVIAYRNEFVEENCPPNSDGQVSRVAARFGLVAAGGEIATAFGILPWEPGEANRAAARCFADWLASRGGVEPAEEREGISAVRRFIELHGTSRFEPMGSLAPTDSTGAPLDVRVSNRAGFRRRDDEGGVEYIVLPEVWRGEVCAGLDSVAVARTLARRGGLKPGSGGKLQDVKRLPGFSKPVRCYVITSGILGEDAGDEAHA